jgi:hypothetical protein
MSRSLVVIVALSCLLVIAAGYLAINAPSSDGLRSSPLVAEKTVDLPYDEIHRKGEFQIKISAIPGVRNAVKIKVYAQGIHTHESRECVQQGPARLVFSSTEARKNTFWMSTNCTRVEILSRA